MTAGTSRTTPLGERPTSAPSTVSSVWEADLEPAAVWRSSWRPSRARLDPTELIYCFDPDGQLNLNGFADAAHCDHVHFGFDR